MLLLKYLTSYETKLLDKFQAKSYSTINGNLILGQILTTFNYG